MFIAQTVIHTVGPVGEKPDLLRAAYQNSMTVAADNGCDTIAFPCISTKCYKYPNRLAAPVAIQAVKDSLIEHESILRVIFCVYLPIDQSIYLDLLDKFFPPDSGRNLAKFDFQI